jgi:hypothetical protein
MAKSSNFPLGWPNKKPTAHDPHVSGFQQLRPRIVELRFPAISMRL